MCFVPNFKKPGLYPETPQLKTLCLTKAPATDVSGGVGRHSHGKIHQSPDTHESNSHNSNYFKDFPTKPVDTEMETSSGLNSDSEDDEFFECNESDNDDKEMQDIQSIENSINQELPVWSQSAEGRQSRFGKLKLLQHDDWLYVPVCQDPTPMTEDMLAEQAEVMKY